MPSAKGGIGVPGGGTFGSVPPPVPTCPPPSDAEITDTGNGIREGVSVAFQLTYPSLYRVIHGYPRDDGNKQIPICHMSLDTEQRIL